LLAILFRVGMFAYAAILPISNEDGLRVSPTTYQRGIDFSFYSESAEAYASVSIVDLFGKYVAFYNAPFSEQRGYITAGPVFPLLISALDYSEVSTIPLALLFLFMATALAVMWLLWLDKMGVSFPWLIIFALLPNPLWFMLNISSDLPLAFLTACFYLLYFRDHWRIPHVIGWLIVVALAVLTRPNGYSLVVFVFLDLVLRRDWDLQKRFVAGGLAGAFAVLCGLYLYPYFVNTMKMTAELRANYFFGISQDDFVIGVFSQLPSWLDVPLSWLSLLGAKTLYLVGLRPSFADVDWWIVFLRAGAGVIMLPGLVYVALCGGRRHRLLIGLFVLPILLGPSQDRYILPIQPLLFYFGWLLVQRLAQPLRIVLRARASTHVS